MWIVDNPAEPERGSIGGAVLVSNCFLDVPDKYQHVYLLHMVLFQNCLEGTFTYIYITMLKKPQVLVATCKHLCFPVDFIRVVTAVLTHTSPGFICQRIPGASINRVYVLR
jgi:hypothetical protein